MRNPARFLFLLTAGLTMWASLSVSAGILENTRTQIAKAKKAEDLYNVRIQLKKSSQIQGQNAQQLEELAESFRILSGGFARFSHYKNSVEAYTNYLQISEKIIDMTRIAQLDSINAAHQRIEKTETNEISSLQSGLNALEAKQSALSNYREKYFMWGAIAAGSMIVFFLLTFGRINRKIKSTEISLLQSKAEVKQLFSNSVFTRMAGSIPGYLQNYAKRNAELLDQLTAQLEPDNEKGGKPSELSRIIESMSKKLRA